MIKENMLSIYTIKSLNYERCEQRFVYSKCRKKMQCLICINKHKKLYVYIIFFIFTDTTILNIDGRCLTIQCGADPKFTDYSCNDFLSSICSNLGKNIDCLLIFFSMSNMC